MSEKPRKIKRTAEGAGFFLWKAGNAWQRHVRENLKPTGITHVQFLLLDAMLQLESNGAKPSQVLLSRTAGTDVMMTSKVLRAMEKQKLVARKSDRADGRAMILQITTLGKKKVSLAKTAIRKSETAFFSKLTTKPHKFIANLQALAE